MLRTALAVLALLIPFYLRLLGLAACIFIAIRQGQGVKSVRFSFTSLFSVEFFPPRDLDDTK